MPDYTVETRVHEGHTIQIKYDLDAPNPRNDEPLGSLVAWYKGSPRGDAHHFTCVEDWLADLLPDHEEPSLDDLPGLVLPIYIYEHGMMALNHEPSRSDWHSRPIFGYSYVSDERLREEQIVTDGEVDYEWARKSLDGELTEFCNWLNGSVYVYLIYPNCQCCHQPILNQPASEVCGGFYDQDHAMNEAVAMVGHLNQSPEQEAAAG